MTLNYYNFLPLCTKTNNLHAPCGAVLLGLRSHSLWPMWIYLVFMRAVEPSGVRRDRLSCVFISGPSLSPFGFVVLRAQALPEIYYGGRADWPRSITCANQIRTSRYSILKPVIRQTLQCSANIYCTVNDNSAIKVLNFKINPLAE
jgi:hypothetical protein